MMPARTRRSKNRRFNGREVGFAFVLLSTLCLAGGTQGGVPTGAVSSSDGEYADRVRPMMQKYCLGCHSTEKHKGSLDLERFGTLAQVRKDVKPWQMMNELLEAREMPPKGKPQPTEEERRRLIAWVGGFLDAEAIARAGDPGFVPMRRLSNAEYDYTVRDLTGVDLRPARQFPADGAAGEGFANAAEALADVSPVLLNKYLMAAKEIAAHAVLLPKGFRFSPNTTRRDWSDEGLAQLRQFYAQFTSDGRLSLQPYLVAMIRYRGALLAGKVTPEEAAAKEKLNAKYFRALWLALSDERPSFPLDQIRAHWRRATEQDAGALTAEIVSWQAKVWKVVPIGSYREGNVTRQAPNDAAMVQTQALKLAVKPAPGQRDVVLYLCAREIFPVGNGQVIWGRPRLEGAKKSTLLLRDYPKFGPAYELDFAAVFADASRYLAAVIDAAHDGKLSPEQLAERDHLDVSLLKRWIELMAIEPAEKQKVEPEIAMVAAIHLEPLGERTMPNGQNPAIQGWSGKGADLPIVVSNSSDVELHIPGRASAHRVVVHPTPTEFVAAAWKSPVDGIVRVTAKVEHVHPNCGNGVAWWVEHRHADRAGVLTEGLIELGGVAQMPARAIKVAKGDLLILAVDAKDGNHSCDLTEIALTVNEVGASGRTWDLAGDVANNILDGNPHADKLGNQGVWSFVKGPTRPVGAGAALLTQIPANSVLGRWRDAAVDPKRRAEADRLADQVQALLVGPRPAKEKEPDGILYDQLASGDGVLFQGLDVSHVGKRKIPESDYGLDPSRFGVAPKGLPGDDASVAAPAGSVVELRLPAALLRDRELVVDVRLDAAEGAVACEALTEAPSPSPRGENKGALVTAPGVATADQLRRGFDDFRNCFPLFICFPGVIPVDEVVCLKMYHREDEPLIRLFLDDAQRHYIDRLWAEHRFITQWPIAENKYLPLFIGFVTQDQTKELLAYFEGQREPFRKRAEALEKELEAASAKQLEALADFAGRAYRRPLREREKADLLKLYATLRAKGVPHEEAFRGVLARVLVAPSFLFRVEQSPPGTEPGPVDDGELATRLSYFLWASVPDEELRRVAAAGRLHEPNVLADQARRMLKDDRVRALGVEFGTQWIHVRGFDAFNEKSEKLYPGFDQNLRAAMYEESILLFQDLFQHDRPISHLLDADYTYLNESLARHYGIPGVMGPQWRKVDGVRKYGRGGILGLASVQAKQAGAARTSPVLRGNWVVETLLGEKLPRPPPDVPKLPEEEGAGDGLTMRQLVEKHTRIESCAVCHQRMDPIGFSFERYDAIGRWRDKESTGLPIDCRAKLKDGTEFEGLDGLRDYLLKRKKDVIVRVFCRRLVGYAVGRAVTLSDQSLIEAMAAGLNRSDGRLSDAVLEIVRSPQFRMIRGRGFVEGGDE